MEIISIYFSGVFLTFYFLLFAFDDLSKSALLALIWPITVIGLLVVLLCRALATLLDLLVDLLP